MGAEEGAVKPNASIPQCIAVVGAVASFGHLRAGRWPRRERCLYVLRVWSWALMSE